MTWRIRQVELLNSKQKYFNINVNNLFKTLSVFITHKFILCGLILV